MILSYRHPWIFSGAIAKITGADGDLLPVSTPDGKIVGWGLYSAGSQIAVRMLSYTPDKPAADWLEQRISAAWQLRKTLHIASNAYRLVNSEGDFLPGLIIDIYNQTTVVRPASKSMELLLSRISACVQKLFPDNVVFVKRDEYTARKEQIAITNGYLDKQGSGREIIEEHGIRFVVDIVQGQKTGFYLDQRGNRHMLQSLAQNRRVLNLFCYTGGFSLHAAVGGASAVTSVDSSSLALELARESAALNPSCAACSLDWVKADAMEYLTGKDQADIIILDPPPFAKKQGEVPGALKGYKHLNRKAIESVSKNGIIFTFSCSGNIDKNAFFKTIFQAGRDAGRDIRMLRELHAAADHPFAINHPEGEYLKGWILYVD